MGLGVKDRLDEGARNLLLTCAECEPGQRVLLVYETEDDGYYDPGLRQEIDRVAAELGLVTESFGVPILRDVADPDAQLTAKMAEADCTVFLARLGDQTRFRAKSSAVKQIISYALDRDMLASPFGTVNYRAFDALKHLVNQAMAQAMDIHVTCPAGTDFRGRVADLSSLDGDLTCKRFPVSISAPIPAMGFTGQIAQQGFLTGTGSNFYTPGSCRIDETLMVTFAGNRLTGFEGSDRDKAAATAHYEYVGAKYGIDTWFVHSWHAGIHPGCEYKQAAGHHFERWSGGAFGNPRLLHFHTCGNYPPGEISLNVLDPSVRIDGVPIWEHGVLHPERLPGGKALLEGYPAMAEAFRNPATRVGEAPCGRLRYG